MSEEMINLESYDTLGIKMADPIQAKLNECPQPRFFMDPRKALPFWLVRSLGDKMPMVSIPEKLRVPYTRGMVGESLVTSLDPNKFVTIDLEGIDIEYKPLHDKHLKNFFKSPSVLKSVEKTGDIVDGQTVCTLKEYNEYRKFIHRLQLNYVSQQKREEEELKLRQSEVDKFLRLAKKDGKERWNRKFNEYLKIMNQRNNALRDLEKKQKCLERLKRVDVGRARVQEEQMHKRELRHQKWLDYKRRMNHYFKNKQEAQRRETILAKKRWVLEATVNKHRKSLVQNEERLKRELKMEENWNRRMKGQKLKLQKDELVRDQYNASIQLMRQRREKYYDCKDVEIDELLSLPGMNSLEELEIFNTQVDQFSPEFVNALRGAKFHINRSGKSLTLDKSLRKYIVHRESAAERMKKANVARPIKYALDLLIRRSVGYYAMVVTYNTIKNASDMAQQLANKIRTSPKLRELLLEEYRQFGPRSDIPFQTLKNFDDKGLGHCMCDYTLVDKETLEWPCPLCRKDKISPADSEISSSSSSKESEKEPEELYVIGEGTTTVGFLVPPKMQKETDAELIMEEQKQNVETLFEEIIKPFVPPPPIPEEIPIEETPPETKKQKSPLKHEKGLINAKGSKTSKKSQSPRKEVVKKASSSSASSRSLKKSPRISPTSPNAQDLKTPKRSRSTSASKKKSKFDLKSRVSKKSKSKRSMEKRGKPKSSKTKPKATIKGKKGVEGDPKVSLGSRSKTSVSSKHRSRSILKVKSDKPKSAQKGPSKGVSFAIDSKRPKTAKSHHGGKRVPSVETAPLLKSAVLPSTSQQKCTVEGSCSKIASNMETDAHHDLKDDSVVSLLSITSDNRMRFVKGQCVFDKKRGSKLGKLKPSSAPTVSKVKKGFIKGTCHCKDHHRRAAKDVNVTERLSGDKSVMKKIKDIDSSRWRKVLPKEECSEEGKLKDVSWPRDLSGILDKLSDRKEMKLKYLMGAQDLTVKCMCEKCQKLDPPPAENEQDQEVAEESNAEAAKEIVRKCKCRIQNRKLEATPTSDLLAHITKFIGKKQKFVDYDEVSQYMKESAHKVSIRTMVERTKSIISKLVYKKSSVASLPPSQRKEPLVHKYYVDERGMLYILNRRGEKTVLSDQSKHFMVDENGRKHFIDEETGNKYYIDVTNRVYLENDEGDVFSLFYEDGREYVNPQQRRLLLHELVRESVLDLLQSTGQDDDVPSNEDVVEMIYEYLFEGANDPVLPSPANEPSPSEHGESFSDDEELEGAAANMKSIDFSKKSEFQAAARMPIKRPLHMLIQEVPSNRDISRLFIQRKKYHDCCAIVFRRCLLYSLAKYAQIMQTGFDPLNGMDEKKRVTELDSVVKGLTKITAHYPLKLIKSKRLAPYVDALVHGFIGTQGYNIFPGRGKGSVRETLSREGEYDYVDEPVHISQVENLESMKHYCCFNKEDLPFFENKPKNP